MRQLYIQFDAETGEVLTAQLRDAALPAPWVDTGETDFPPFPTQVPTNRVPKLTYRGGKLTWVFNPEPEPEPEPEPVGNADTLADPLAGLTLADIKARRLEAYRAQVDPLTCELARLRDTGGTEDEIATVRAERDRLAAHIAAQFPYPSSEL